MRPIKPYRKPSTFRWTPVVFGVFVFLVILRLILPYVILRAANRRLAELPDYSGHIDGIHLAIWRGAIELKHLTLTHDPQDIHLTIDRLIMHFRWRPLLHRKLVIKLWVEKPDLEVWTRKPQETAKHAVPDTSPIEASSKEGYRALPDALSALIPFQIEWFELDGGRIAIRPQPTTAPAPEHQTLPPHSELEVSDIQIQLRNLTNSRALAGSLTADGSASARLMSKGKMEMTLKLNPLAKTPAFDLTFVIERFDLADLNPLLDWQWNLLVKKGTFEFYSEAQAAEGGFQGYVKPFLLDLEVDTPEGKKGPLQTLKKVAVNIVAKVLKNDDTERVATKVPFQGRFENPKVGIWEAVVNVLRNAFITAIQPHLDRSMHLT